MQRLAKKVDDTLDDQKTAGCTQLHEEVKNLTQIVTNLAEAQASSTERDKERRAQEEELTSLLEQLSRSLRSTNNRRARRVDRKSY